MTKHASELEALAREAAIAYAEKDSVGSLLRTSEEGDGVSTYYFASKLKGYKGWEWCVALCQLEGQDATISEVVLLPSESSLLAPAWVPWSERLAEWKALQAEQEAIAAAEAAANQDEFEEQVDDEPVEDGVEESAELDGAESSTAEELPATNLEEGEDAEADTDDAGVKPPRFSLRNRRWGKKKKK